MRRKGIYERLNRITIETGHSVAEFVRVLGYTDLDKDNFLRATKGDDRFLSEFLVRLAKSKEFDQFSIRWILSGRGSMIIKHS
jgi:hypothetical protein